MPIEDVLSSKGRVRILRILADIGELNISEIARRAGLNYATTNQHLKVLEEHQLVKHKKFGRIRIFRYNEENPRARMVRQLMELWDK
ncbi:MAG: ArsR/SmtB family transcription factor [Candidatus Bathyarchaeia archaeon]